MGKITVNINGKQQILTESCNIQTCLRELNLSERRHLAVAVNGAVVRREQFGSTTICEGDRIEIVRPVGGG